MLAIALLFPQYLFHYGLIISAQISKATLFAARALEDADTLAVAQQGFVEVVNAARIFRQESLQELVRGFG
jgi:hypothetical protein